MDILDYSNRGMGACSVSKSQTQSTRCLCLGPSLFQLATSKRKYSALISLPLLHLSCPPPSDFLPSTSCSTLIQNVHLQDDLHPSINMQRAVMKRQKKRKDKPVPLPDPVPVSLEYRRGVCDGAIGELKFPASLTSAFPLPEILTPASPASPHQTHDSDPSYHTYR